MHHPHIKGALWMLLGALFIAFFSLFLKLASEHTNAFWVVWIAFGAGFLITALIHVPLGIQALKTNRLPAHLGRAFFGVIAAILFLFALQKIPLFNATLLLNTSPLFIPIFSIFFFKAEVPLKIWIALAIGFVGIIFIIRPTREIFEQLFDLVGLASGITLGLAFIFVKTLSSTEPAMRINFYFLFLGLLFLSPFIPLFGKVPPQVAWMYGALAGVMLFFQQVCIITSYRYSDASHVGPLQFAAVVFVGILDWALFHKIPTWVTLVGTLLVIVGAALSMTLQVSPKPKVKT